MGKIVYLRPEYQLQPKRKRKEHQDKNYQGMIKTLRWGLARVRSGTIAGFAFVALRPNGKYTAGILNIEDESMALEAVYRLEGMIRGEEECFVPR